MRFLRRISYAVIGLAVLAIVYQVGIQSARGQDEFAVAMTSNLLLSSEGRVFVREVRSPQLDQTWKLFGSIDQPAVDLIEFRGGPFPACEILTPGGDVYQLADDGTGVRKRFVGNGFGVFRNSTTVTPKVITRDSKDEK